MHRLQGDGPRVGRPLVTAPAGALVKLYVDTRGEITKGDVIRTGTGRRYLVETVRVQERGKHAGRKHLTAVVLAPTDQIPWDTAIIDIRWYRR